MRRIKGMAIGLLLTLSACMPWDEEKVDPEKAQAPAVSRLTIALGQGGANYSAGNAVCVALKKSGSTLPCKLLASNGSQQNILAMADKQVDLALVRADSAYQAWHGQKPFVKRNPKLRVLFSLHHEALTLLVKENAQIFSFKQIHNGAIHMGLDDSRNSGLILGLLDQCEIPLTNSLSNQESGSLAKLLEQEAVQGGLTILSHPDEQIKALANQMALQLLPVNGLCVERLVDESPFLDRMDIPGGLYQGLASSIPSFGAKVWLMASTDLPDSVVYEVVKAAFEGVEQFRRSDPAFYHLSPRKMLSPFVIPYHVGAVHYFQEKGWYTETR
ncbi:MAG: TAXI family TRAP transporter solute-binding subunit [Magnetococcales bacterium]|nr:TAXI family TRAP transporter solute-binding subunit [Magnetococcales bacterium]